LSAGNTRDLSLACGFDANAILRAGGATSTACVCVVVPASSVSSMTTQARAQKLTFKKIVALLKK
jgi:hypothetical protein